MVGATVLLLYRLKTSNTSSERVHCANALKMGKQPFDIHHETLRMRVYGIPSRNHLLGCGRYKFSTIPLHKPYPSSINQVTNKMYN
jgi:hypothetical protein